VPHAVITSPDRRFRSLAGANFAEKSILTWHRMTPSLV